MTGIEILRNPDGEWEQATPEQARGFFKELFDGMPAFPIGFKLECAQERIRGVSIRELMRSAPERTVEGRDGE